MTVTSNELQECIRKICGTWTRDEFESRLKRGNVPEHELRRDMHNFGVGEDLLRKSCEAECYPCGIDVITHFTGGARSNHTRSRRRTGRRTGRRTRKAKHSATSGMKDEEKVVISNMVTQMINAFKRHIKDWKHSMEEAAKHTSTSTKVAVGKAAVGASVMAGVGVATLGVAAVPAMAIMGAIGSFSKVRSAVMRKGIDLIEWIIKDPRTAMMFLFIAKGFIRSACRESAKMFALETYERESRMGRLGSGVKDFANTVVEGVQMTGGSIVRAAVTGEAWKGLWKSAGTVATTAMVSVGAVVGAPAMAVGIGTAIVGGLVNAAEEASRFGLEMAAYQKDMETGMGYVGDILFMLVDPKRCMEEHGVVKFTSCSELSMAPQQCERGGCKYTDGGDGVAPTCEDAPCETHTTQGPCSTSHAGCIWGADNKCKPDKSWVGSIKSLVGGATLKQSILDHEAKHGRDITARRWFNQAVSVQGPGSYEL